MLFSLRECEEGPSKLAERSSSFRTRKNHSNTTELSRTIYQMVPTGTASAPHAIRNRLWRDALTIRLLRDRESCTSPPNCWHCSAAPYSPTQPTSAGPSTENSKGSSFYRSRDISVPEFSRQGQKCPCSVARSARHAHRHRGSPHESPPQSSDAREWSRESRPWSAPFPEPSPSPQSSRSHSRP